MAAVGCCKTMLSLTVLLIVFVSLPELFAKQAPTPEEVSEWAKKVDKNLRNLNRLFDIVNGRYKTKQKASDITVEYKDVNETQLVKEMAAKLAELLKKQMEALDKSVKAAEKAAAAYKWNVDLTKDDVTYENSKELLQQGIDLTFSRTIGRDVNYNFSSVHIPVEIYDGDIHILNGLNWTAALDETFKQNHIENPDMLWQYFGSESGFLRSYPATPWPVDSTNGVDLYDVRRQSWYTQGSSSPKDMMILIDTSGSTHGQSLQLMQNAVKSILDTLGENDYVNIVEFSEQAKFVSKCFNHTAFVQANFRNKKQLERDIDRLEASGQADFNEAITFAFDKFIEFEENETNSENNIGANCNKLIMLLSDGGMDDAEEVFRKYNWPNKTVRVFTYAVGPTSNPSPALRWMACANKGYYSQIPAMGAIRARVQGYSENLRELVALADGHDTSWEITLDPRGLGMMTTVTLPVYNRSTIASNQTILGVMGIDVTTERLEAETPFAKIGPNGYSFAINPNGYTVFHPNLDASGRFLVEPPNIDILEMEIDENNEDMKELRSKMIMGKPGTALITTYFLSPDKRYVSYAQAKYAYAPIENTTFRLGLCVPVYQKKYPKFSGNMQIFDWSNAQSDAFEILIAPWEYYKNMTKQKNLTGTLDDILGLLQKDSNPDNWNLDMLYHLYWDVSHIEPSLVMFLKNISDSANETDSDSVIGLFDEDLGSRTVFIMTNGGMTLVSPATEASYFEPLRDPRKSSLYKRALYSNKCIFQADFTEGKRSNTSRTPYVTTACGVFIEGDHMGSEHVIDKPAVVGERLTHDQVMNAVHHSVDELTMSQPSLATCRDEELICYLVDDGGFVVATNRDDYREQMGRFFGLVDPTVFGDMNEEVFHRAVQYDFQATCEVQEDTISAGFKDFHIPSMNMLFEVLNVGWWTSKVSWAFSSFNLFSWLFSPINEAYAYEDDTEKACVEASYQYSVKDAMKHYEGGVQCQNCTRNFTAVKLGAYTNLLFIVTEPMCEECEELYPPISQADRELTEAEEENIICEMAQNPRKRIQAYTCYHSDPREDASECGCAALQVSYASVLLVLLSIAWRWTSLTR